MTVFLKIFTFSNKKMRYSFLKMSRLMVHIDWATFLDTQIPVSIVATDVVEYCDVPGSIPIAHFGLS